MLLFFALLNKDKARKLEARQHSHFWSVAVEKKRLESAGGWKIGFRHFLWSRGKN